MPHAARQRSRPPRRPVLISGRRGDYDW